MSYPSWEDFKKYLKEQQEINPIKINPGEESDEDRVKRLLVMFPPERVAKIMEKELRRFKGAQAKKWRNWLLAVSK